MKELSPDEIKETTKNYDRFASEHDELWGPVDTWSPIDRANFETYMAALPPKAKVLEAGCGSGRALEHLATKGFDVSGVDLSPGMIEEAKKHVGEDKVQVGDIHNLPFPNETFDGVFSRYVLHHSNNPTEALKEMNRVAKPDGTIYIASPVSSDEQRHTNTFQLPNERTLFSLRHPSDVIKDSLTQGPIEIIKEQIISPSEKPVLHIVVKKHKNK